MSETSAVSAQGWTCRHKSTRLNAAPQGADACLYRTDQDTFLDVNLRCYYWSFPTLWYRLPTTIVHCHFWQLVSRSEWRWWLNFSNVEASGANSQEARRNIVVVCYSLGSVCQVTKWIEALHGDTSITIAKESLTSVIDLEYLILFYLR